MRPIERLKRKLGLESLWLLVLSLLKRRPLSGKEIRKRIQQKYGLLTGMVTAYKVLYLLEEGGYVKSKKSGKYVLYKITPKGKNELKLAKELLKRYARRL